MKIETLIIILNITDMQTVKQTDIWNHTVASLFEWWLNFEKLSTLLKLFSSLDSKCTCIPTFALYIHLSICLCMYTSYIYIFYLRYTYDWIIGVVYILYIYIIYLWNVLSISVYISIHYDVNVPVYLKMRIKCISPFFLQCSIFLSQVIIISAPA